MQKLLRLKIFVVLGAILFLVPIARAQNPTIVSGTIADTNSVPYYPATVTACLTPTTIDPIANRIHINNSVGQNYCVGPVSTSASGFFSASIPPNSSITPGGTQYVFTVSALGSSPPSGKGPQIFRVTITVSGSSQDVSATLNASAPNLLFGGGGTSSFGPNFSVGGGVAQFQTVSPATPITNATLVAGYELCWLPVASNTGAIPTLAGAGTSTFSATIIAKNGVSANLVANDIVLGTIACVKYDGTSFQLQNPQAGLVASASLTLGGGAAAAGATATGGFACGEATNTGWTPTVGYDYIRCDSATHTLQKSENGNAEAGLGGSSTFPITVSGTVVSGGVPYFNSTVQESSSAVLATNALVVGGGAGAAPTTGNGVFTVSGNTLTAAAAGIVDLSAETGLGSFRIPVTNTDSNGTTPGYLHIHTSNGVMNFDGGGTNVAVALAGTGGSSSTTCTNQVVTQIAGNAAPTCTSLTNAFLPASITATAALSGATHLTATNCSSSASPAVCGSAAAGSVAVPTGVTPTLVVNTTAVTANSQILFTPDESLGTKLSVTCNSTIAQVAIEPIVTARTAATSFTITYNTTVTTNPICLSYFIIN